MRRLSRLAPRSTSTERLAPRCTLCSLVTASSSLTCTAAASSARAASAAVRAFDCACSRAVSSTFCFLGALGCVGSAGVALFYEEPRGGWED